MVSHTLAGDCAITMGEPENGEPDVPITCLNLQFAMLSRPISLFTCTPSAEDDFV